MALFVLLRAGDNGDSESSIFILKRMLCNRAKSRLKYCVQLLNEARGFRVCIVPEFIENILAWHRDED